MQSTQRALVEYPYKLIRNLDTEDLMLYDLASDPGERHNLSVSEPELVADLLAKLERLHATAEAATKDATATPELSPDELDALRSLGYIR